MEGDRPEIVKNDVIFLLLVFLWKSGRYMITVHSGQVLIYFTESLLLFGCLPSVGEATYQTLSTLSHLITIAGLLFFKVLLSSPSS